MAESPTLHPSPPSGNSSRRRAAGPPAGLPLDPPDPLPVDRPDRSDLKEAFRSPAWRVVLRGCLAHRRTSLLEALVLSPNEATSIHLRAQILLLDWLTDGRWEAEELTPETSTVPPAREYLARDRDE